MRRLSTTSLLLVALGLLACNKPTEESAVCESDIEQIRSDILVPNCTNEFCHDADAPAANLDFTRSAEDIAAQLLDVPSAVCADWVRVVPGDLERSMLFAKLHDPPCGEQMPIDGHLSDHEIGCIRHWIETVENTCETCGGDLCVDLQSDAQHCGACDNACPAGVACVAGACSCPSGTELCGDACVDTSSDPEHCGGCGQSCGGVGLCNAGSCAGVGGCNVGLVQCGASCVDTQTSDLHCGGCDQPCAEGMSCVAGECGCAGEDISFADQVEPLLVDHCALAGCHAPPQLEVALDLREGEAYDNLVGVASEQCESSLRVDPGNPGSSYLLDKLLGVSLCDGFQMPLNTDPLQPAEIQLISDWICQGAQDN